MTPETSSADVKKVDADESLSILVAAYREAENLTVLLPRLTAVVRELTPDFEILIIDTVAPMDNTETVCATNGVRLLRRRPGNDYGDALRTGLAASRGDFLVNMDADGSHNPEFIRELWGQRHRADVVVASRYVVGGQTDNPPLLVAMSRVLNGLFRSVVGFPVLDVSNSFRLYRGEQLRALRLTYQHFDILEEILAKLLWRTPEPARIVEIPYRFGRRLTGKSKRNLFVFGLYFAAAAIRLRRLRRRMAASAQS